MCLKCLEHKGNTTSDQGTDNAGVDEEARGTVRGLGVGRSRSGVSTVLVRNSSVGCGRGNSDGKRSGNDSLELHC